MGITEEIEKLSEKLQILGLSKYEARVYTALVVYGYGDVTTISSTGLIPRTSTYKVLRSLQNKGFVMYAKGRPMIYRPTSPEEIKERFLRNIENLFTTLMYMYEVAKDRGVPQLVYTISEKGKVINKIGELVDKAEHTFIISTPLFSELKAILHKKIENALQRGVNVTIITAPFQKVPENVNVVWREGLIATDVICDCTNALIASPDLNACGYTDNAILAEHLYRFLQIIIEHNSSIKR